MKNNYLIFRNGKRIDGNLPLEQILLPPAPFGLGRSDVFHFGFFESLRTYDGSIWALHEHVKRLQESASTCGHRLKTSLKSMIAELKEAVDVYYEQSGSGKKEDIFVRLSLWKDERIIFIGKRRHAVALYAQGVCLKTSPVKRTLSSAEPAEIKTSAYQNAVLASIEPSQKDTYEWLFLDQEGYVTEVRIGNLFIIKDRILITPIPVGILNGVTRKFVLKCAKEARFKAQESRLMRHDVYNADEAFLTNTSWEILPVKSLDGRKIGKKVPGDITLQLQRKFHNNIRDY